MSPLILLGYACAVLIGLSLGLLGGGGSILTVPVLHYVLGYEARTAAVPMSLVVVGVTSALGAVQHWRGGTARAPRAPSPPHRRATRHRRDPGPIPLSPWSARGWGC